MINRLFRVFSTISRRRKLSLLEASFPLKPTQRALEIGGELGGGMSERVAKQLEKVQLTVVNRDRHHLQEISAAHSQARFVQCDARRMVFSDKAFDLVFSNAVIEHVGDLEDQAAMAREVMRVGKCWFVTTPNRWYPFEFHTRLPFVGWLPEPAMSRVTKLWSYDHAAGRYQSGMEAGARLMTAGELGRIFPNSIIVRQRVTFWPETLIAIGPKEEIATSALRTAP